MSVLRLIYGVFICLSFCGSASAYTRVNSVQKTLDSLLKSSGKDVYENPNKTIGVGLMVYNDNESSIKTRVRALMLISLAYTSKRDYQKALEQVIKANELSQQLNDPILNIEILFRTGILYQQLKIFDKSIKYLDDTEQRCLTYPVRDSVGFFLGNTYLVKGFIYKDNLNCDIALGFFEKGIAEYQSLKGTSHRANLSIAYYNKGNCYRLLAQFEDAKNSFHKSIAFAELEKANSLIAFAKKGLAEVYTLEGKYTEAIDLLNEGLLQSKNVGDKVLYQGIYKGLYENYLALNEWEAYQKNYNLYLKTQLEIKKSERHSVSDSIDENSKNQLKKRQEVQNQYDHNIKWIILIALLIIIAVVFIEIKNRKSIKSLQKQVEISQNLKQTSKSFKK